METKTFDLRTVLTVTTGRLLTKSKGERDNGIGDLYELLGWMTNDAPFTHQLGRFGEECKPWLLRWFPELQRAPLDLLGTMIAMDAGAAPAVERFIQVCIDAEGMKPTYGVPRIPADDHERKHPYDELVAMRGTDEGIHVVESPE